MVGVGGRHATGEREHQRDGVLGGGDGVAAGRVHDHDALARGGGHVDVVDADAGADDRAELARVLQTLGGDLGLRADDAGIELAERGGEFVALETEAGFDFDPGVPEQFDPGGFELVGDQHARHCDQIPETVV